VLAQFIAEGPNSVPLDARISFSPPSASLPTPPSHKAASPDASRLAIEFFALSETDVQSVADALTILLEYYSVQDLDTHPYVSAIAMVQAPKASIPRDRIYKSFKQFANTGPELQGQMPNSSVVK
jgi:cyclin K